MVVKIAKIDDQEMHGKNAKFLHFLIILYSGLFSSRKYFRHFYPYSPMTKINSTKLKKIILMNTFIFISTL